MRIFFQPKLDGIRCIAMKSGLFSRTGKPIVACPHIHAALAPVFKKYPNAVLDGELYNHDLKHDFNQIVSMVRQTKPTKSDIQKSESMVQYHVYDLASSEDTFASRIDQLSDLVNLVTDVPSKRSQLPYIQLVTTRRVADEKELDTHYGAAIQSGYEGGIIRLDDVYQQKRSNFLIKRKDFEDAEFTILRIEEGKGNWSGVAKRVFFENDVDGREVGAGLKGSKDYARHVLENADSYIGKQVTVQFFTRTPDGVPRFPIAKQLHKDKRW